METSVTGKEGIHRGVSREAENGEGREVCIMEDKEEKQGF